MSQLIEASMADLARGLDGTTADDGAPAAAPATVDLALGPAWLAEDDALPVEPVLAVGSAPTSYTDVEDGEVVTTTDDALQLDRSARLSSRRLAIG